MCIYYNAYNSLLHIMVLTYMKYYHLRGIIQKENFKH